MRITLHRLNPREVDHELVWGSLVLLILGVARWFPFEVFPPPRCPFKFLTGYPCCTCGLTRGLVAFAHGDFVSAFLWNPLVALIAALAIVYGAYAMLVVICGWPRVRVMLTSLWERVAVRVLVLVCILGNWVYLLAMGR